MRRAACILLIREDGKFLLQHRTEDAPRMPGYWALFGGKVEAGETPEQAVARETKEELSIDLVNHTLALRQEFTNDIIPEGVELSLFTAPFEAQGAINQREGQAMGWYTLKDIRDLKMAPQDITAITTVLTYKKNGA